MKHVIIGLIVYVFITISTISLLKGASTMEPREEYEIREEEQNLEEKHK